MTIKIKNYFNQNSEGKFLHNQAFTLIELLIVIGILAILATVTLLVINPAQMIKQSRDATRFSDIATILEALQVYSGSGVNESSMGSTNTIYISVPAVNSNCSDLNLPTPLSGWSYACSTSANYRKTDGTGWIPVDLSSLAYGSPIDSLPIDPINATSTNLYYTYIKGSIALSAGMESDKYLTSTVTTDGGYSPYRYEAGNDVFKNSYLPNCGGLPVTDIDGNIYNAVQIGKQCWMKSNIMTTKYPDGTAITRGPTGATWDGTDHAYYAYPPNTSNNAEETLANIISNNLGFIYQWSAAMKSSTVAGSQGICPSGWHIPTDAEWKILVESQATAGCESSTGWQCSPAGSHLSNYTLNHDNTSGFSGILAGYRETTGSFGTRASNAYIWSSSGGGGGAWRRFLNSGYAEVYRSNNNCAYGFSVRCLKN